MLKTGRSARPAQGAQRAGTHVLPAQSLPPALAPRTWDRAWPRTSRSVHPPSDQNLGTGPILVPTPGPPMPPRLEAPHTGTWERAEAAGSLSTTAARVSPSRVGVGSYAPPALSRRQAQACSLTHPLVYSSYQSQSPSARGLDVSSVLTRSGPSCGPTLTAQIYRDAEVPGWGLPGNRVVWAGRGDREDLWEARARTGQEQTHCQQTPQQPAPGR